MGFTLWLRYLIGEGRAIRELAENRATLWTGIGLVILTSIARNYDQTFIAEKPFLWLFGSLLFSVISGTWLYLVLYGWFVRRATTDADGKKPEFWSRWRCFIGLFWMTAPVAWLYAIPVERFLDSVSAAKANLTILGIVSLWRVLLITRVIQFLTRARFYAVLLWVLFAAAMEILVVFFFGGAFAKAIMSGMGGMRNSPEETLMVNALGTVFVGAFWSAPVFLMIALMVGSYQSADDIPAPIKSRGGFGGLLIAASIWMAVAVFPQIEVSRNARLESMFAEAKYADAMNYLSERQPTDFSPARVLAPNAFEPEIFTELPACFGLVQTNTPAWVRGHLMLRLDQMVSHYAQHWYRHKSIARLPRDEQVDYVANGIRRYGPEAVEMLELVNGLARIPEGNEWMRTNAIFLEGIEKACVEASDSSRNFDAETRAAWMTLKSKLEEMGITDGGSTNTLPR